MKLLFDENLAARLAKDLAEFYPGSLHVQALGLLGAPDHVVWSRAASQGFVLVTKDADFHRLSVVLGPPPKVLWIRLGNGSTADTAHLLRSEMARIEAFVGDVEAAFLSLGR